VELSNKDRTRDRNKVSYDDAVLRDVSREAAL